MENPPVTELTAGVSPCPLCRARLPEYGRATFKVSGGVIPTPVYYCRACDVMSRPVPHARLTGHFEDAGYTRERNREALGARREQFFHHIVDLMEEHVGTGARSMLDVGAAYGHLIRVARSRGHDAAGVEIVDRLREKIDAMGARSWSSLSEATGSFDCACFIDSFHYFEDPHEAIDRATALLKPGGVMIIRVSNRNLLIRTLHALRSTRTFDPLHDAIVGWSLKGFHRLAHDHDLLLERALFTEPGWNRPAWQRSVYGAAGLISRITAPWRKAVSPGLTVVLLMPADVRT
jgi:SAM-dependent methyltransferase